MSPAEPAERATEPPAELRAALSPKRSYLRPMYRNAHGMVKCRNWLIKRQTAAPVRLIVQLPLSVHPHARTCLVNITGYGKPHVTQRERGGSNAWLSFSLSLSLSLSVSSRTPAGNKLILSVI